LAAKWALITSDYTWGHNTAKGIRGIVEGNGGKIVEELVVPQNARDFSSPSSSASRRSSPV
jgi:branched-chain amino acid transport system substrate-binding protein